MVLDIDHFRDDDDFVANSAEQEVGDPEKPLSPLESLDRFDRLIYARLAPRWMDLIGDYAGMEPFVIDGDSLCEIVLRDHLLALGRDNDLSFQIMHAYWSVEKILYEFVRCRCVFDVAFFECNFRLSVLDDRTTPYDEYVTTSRRFARSLLRRHITTIPDITVLTFQDDRDPLWAQYVITKKPLFIMCNDGGHPTSKGPNLNIAVKRALCQRYFMKRTLMNGIAIASLESAEFRDPKILTFIYEHRRGVNDNHIIKETLPSGAHRDVQDGDTSDGDSEATSSDVHPPSSLGEWVTTSSKAFLSKLPAPHSKPVLHTLLYLFLAHIYLLPTIPIEDRAQNIASLSPQLSKILHSHLFPPLFRAFNSTLHSQLSPNHSWRADLDIRVFLHLLEFILKTDAEVSMESLIGAEIAKELEAVWDDLMGTHELMVDFVDLRSQFAPSKLERERSTSPTPSDDLEDDPSFLKVLPFQNEIFDQYLQEIQVTVDNTSSSGGALKGDSTSRNFSNSSLAVHVDDQHWHNRQRLVPRHDQRIQQRKPTRSSSGPGGGLNSQRRLTDADWVRMKRDRAQKRILNLIRDHAESLTGAKGAPLTKIPIPPTGIMVSSIVSKESGGTGSASSSKRQTKKEQPVNRSVMAGKKGGKKGGEPALTSAEKLKLKIQEEKNVELRRETSKWWNGLLNNLQKKGVESQRSELDAVNKKRLEDRWLQTEILLYRIHLELSEWVSESRESEKHALKVLMLIKEVSTSTTLYPTAVAWLRDILDLLGFTELHPFPEVKDAESKKPQKISFTPIKVSPRSSSSSPRYPFMRMSDNAVEFQLKHFGLYMDRSMDSSPDTRVSFEPDAWQKKVLDLIDARSSILVVAPTSAGKTFISFYAMEQVLRESDDGIVIYVAPTKALVNQMLAETAARFSKNLRSGTLWAAHTRDYRINEPMKTQILITVPEMLSIMLLSPSHARIWTPKIRWIILDEIHSIGQQEGGAVWEQLILMAPCPIIGLSATIGNASEFNKWLASVQEQHGFSHSLVEHKHRYSHLRKFYYRVPEGPPASIPPIGTNVSSPSGLQFIHPISVLDTGASNFPEDLALEARDCASLYISMKRLEDGDPTKESELAALSPTMFFKDRQSRFLRQKDVLEYEAALKSSLQRWISRSGDQSQVIEGVISPLKIKTNRDDYLIPSKGRIYANLVPLLNELHNQDCLPAILFNFDRSACELMAIAILKDLQEAEEEWRKTSTEWHKKIKEWEAWKANAKLRAQEAERAAKIRPDEGASLADIPEGTWHANFDPSDPSPEFSFAGLRYGRKELDEDIKQLKWGSPPKEWTIRALARGIAVHHAGMPKNYRSLIEKLFRLGLVRVMISTGTLALGINAPCKTTVFCTDSPYLTALNYRQCSGRAGRRGFDMLGNVVFYGLPIDRAYRLIMSKIPPLTGNVPLTTTLTLRLCNLLHGSQNAKSACGAVGSLLSLPQLSVSSETKREELLHQVRFSLDYLRRSGFLDLQGRPLTLFPIAGHLYHTEPSNLALAQLLREGVIHGICETIDTNSQDTLRNLALVLCHLFGRRYVDRVLRNKKRLEELRKGSPSRIILPPLPTSAKEVLAGHNKDILRIFRGYAYTYTRQHRERLGPDDKLPLSGNLAKSNKNPSVDQMQFPLYLKSRANHFTALSSFVANSGRVDRTIDNVDDLIRTVRSGLHLNKQITPNMEDIFSSNGLPLNAYIWDFFIHGQAEALNRDNMIRRGDIWYALQDFSLAMAAVQMGLENFMKSEGDGDADEMDAHNENEDDLEDKEGFDTKKEQLVEAWKENEKGSTIAFPTKPESITDGDWKVYRALVLLRTEFDEKWKLTWA
ncbi:hypothetical protein FRC03_006079 [Tulasnella sp. 419]|nr:hypothetical protein FRC03_006079 [Tulasnella sp. 419]